MAYRRIALALTIPAAAAGLTVLPASVAFADTGTFTTSAVGANEPGGGADNATDATPCPSDSEGPRENRPQDRRLTTEESRKDAHSQLQRVAAARPLLPIIGRPAALPFVGSRVICRRRSALTSGLTGSCDARFLAIFVRILSKTSYRTGP